VLICVALVPVKVNIFISYAPEDKKQLEKLLRWFYPMRDEVNLFYKDSPKPPVQLSLPWQILLFWYTAPDLRGKYQRIYEAQREKAHIYLFLTSYKSLSNKQIEDDIEVAARRRIEGDDFMGPFVYPILLSPSRWTEESRLAGFKPLADGIPLSSFKQEEDGYLTVTEEVASMIKDLQNRLGEAKFSAMRKVSPDVSPSRANKQTGPYLGDAEESLNFHDIEPFEPPEWLGWSILLFIFISFINYMLPDRPAGAGRYENVKNEKDFGWEYMREHPIVPVKDSVKFPPNE
jgi:hypothetical protein